MCKKSLTNKIASDTKRKYLEYYFIKCKITCGENLTPIKFPEVPKQNIFFYLKLFY